MSQIRVNTIQNANGTTGITFAANGQVTLANTPLQLTGGQIKFPATQIASGDANTLDDYEEGTWTPGINFGGGTTGITYDEQSGTYVKTGQFVYLSGVINLTNKGSSTGNMNLTGLPFVIANITGTRAHGVFTYVDAGSSITGSPTILGAVNATQCELFQSGTSTNITNSNIQNSTAFRFFVVYRASV